MGVVSWQANDLPDPVGPPCQQANDLPKGGKSFDRIPYRAIRWRSGRSVAYRIIFGNKNAGSAFFAGVRHFLPEESQNAGRLPKCRKITKMPEDSNKLPRSGGITCKNADLKEGRRIGETGAAFNKNAGEQPKCRKASRMPKKYSKMPD